MRDKAEVLAAIAALQGIYEEAISLGHANQASFARVLLRALRWTANEPEGFDDPEGSFGNMIASLHKMARARRQ